MDFKKLKSGTDIRGIAVESPQGPVELTDPVIERIAGAFLVWCGSHLGKRAEDLRIAVGRDSRISGPRIRDALRRVFENTA